jgi:hypothetical protein
MPLTTHPRKDVLLQSPRVTRAVTLAPTLLREPFARDGFERLKLRDVSLLFFLFPLSARIDVVGEQSPCFVSLLARTLERHIRIHAECEHLFRLSRLAIGATAEAILEPPPFVLRITSSRRVICARLILVPLMAFVAVPERIVAQENAAIGSAREAETESRETLIVTVQRREAVLSNRHQLRFRWLART